MGQRRDAHLMVNLEPALNDILQKILVKEGISASSYFRRLAIEDLKQSGLLTPSLLLSITEG